MHLLVATVGLALIATILWFAFVPQRVFEVRVEGGAASKQRGVVTDRFVLAVQDVCRQHAIDNGSVSGRALQGRISLAFSRNFPTGAQQQLRNWWAEFGWGSPKPPRDGGPRRMRRR